jgi:hypothetical protein
VIIWVYFTHKIGQKSYLESYLCRNEFIAVDKCVYQFYKFVKSKYWLFFFEFSKVVVISSYDLSITYMIGLKLMLQEWLLNTEYLDLCLLLESLGMVTISYGWWRLFELNHVVNLSNAVFVIWRGFVSLCITSESILTFWPFTEWFALTLIAPPMITNRIRIEPDIPFFSWVLLGVPTGHSLPIHIHHRVDWRVLVVVAAHMYLLTSWGFWSLH